MRWIFGLLSTKSVHRFRRPNHPLQSFWFSAIMKFCARIQGTGDEASRMGLVKGGGRSKTRKEDDHQQYLSILLPAAVDAASTTQLGVDCQIGGCLAICSIATSFNLSIKARQTVCSSIADVKMDSEKTKDAYLTSLACLCKDIDSAGGASDTQEERIITTSTAQKLTAKPHLLASIKRVSQFCNVEDFLFSFIIALSYHRKSSDKDNARSTMKFTEEILLDTEIVPDYFVANVVSHFEESPIDEQDWTNLLASLRQNRFSAMKKSEGSSSSKKESDSLQSKASAKEPDLLSQAEEVLKDASQNDLECNAVTNGYKDSNKAVELYILAMSASFDRSTQAQSSQILTSLFSKIGDASLTLLASVWTCFNLKSEIRFAALCHSHAFLTAFTVKDSKIRHVDFQTIIPSLLVALKDAEAFIRLEALQCLDRISTITEAIENKSKKEEKFELYGYDTIYGKSHSEALKYLDLSDTLHLTRLVVSARASFEHDSFYLNIWAQNNLAVTRGEGKRDIACKKRIVEMLSSHVLCWTNYEAKLSLLDSLSSVQDANKWKTLLPLVKDLVNGHLPSTLNQEQLDAYVGLLFASFDSSISKSMESNEDGSWLLLLEALENGKPVIQKQAARALKKGLFASFSDGKKRELYARIANLVANSPFQLPAELRSCLAELHLETTALIPILQDLRQVISSHALKTSQGKKAKRLSNGLEEEETWTRAMAVLVEILEAMLSRNTTPSSEQLTELFEELRLGTELLLSRQTGSEYLMQISMSNLSASIHFLKEAGHQYSLSADVLSSLRADTVVNVIKTPCNPQTFQQALLLLSAMGDVIPEVVLHNAMPVFTFVGSTMLQRDDDYSFVVIEKTLQSILPPVIKEMTLKSTSKGELALLQASRNLLCVFTDAAKHVPRHRRVTFFHTLVNVMGSDYLAPICMLLTDRYASKVSKQNNLEEVRTTFQLPLSLFSKKQDNPILLWKSLNSIWKEVKRNWTHRTTDAVELQDHVFLDYVGRVGIEHEGRQAGPIKRTIALVKFINLAVRSHLEALEEHSQFMDEESDKEREKIIWEFIEQTLTMSQVNNSSISSLAQDTLEEMMKLAPIFIIFDVTLRLLNSSKMEDKRSGLHLCNKILSNMTDADREKSSLSTNLIIKECYKIVITHKDLAGNSLVTLVALSQDCVPSEHAAFSAGMDQLIQIVKSESSTLQVPSLTLLLSFGKHLGPRLIPKLADLVSLSVSLLKEPSVPLVTKSLVLDLLTQLTRSIPVFAATHIAEIIRLSIQHPSLQDSKQFSTLLSSIVRFIPTLQLLSTIFAEWEGGDKNILRLHTTCLDLLERVIKVSDKKIITSSHKVIFRQLTTILDGRRQGVVETSNWKLSSSDQSLVEDKAVSVFLRLVLKLNEASFRPLFLRFCDWAMLDMADEREEEETGDSNEIIARKVVLFKVINALLGELGELIANYYINVLDGAVDTLKGHSSTSSPDADEVWKQVVMSLQLSAQADKGKGLFWNESRVKTVIPSLIGQISTVLIKNSTLYEALLGDAIAELCQAVPDETSLKTTNNLLLESTRSSQTKVKITAIRILVKIWKSEECENSLLRLVPETVPSIAELLQESEVALQEELSSFVTAVEKVLGEGLESYLQ